jgi:hypothetical protein
MILKSLSYFKEQSSDVDYESLLSLLDQISAQKLTYTKDVSDHLITLLCQIKVTRFANLKSQAWLIFQSAETVVNKENCYYDVVSSRKVEILV